MTYDSKPVFKFQFEYTSAPESRVRYDTNPVQFGYGAPDYERTERQAARTVDATVFLQNDAEIKDFEDFLNDREGGKPFWLPAPIESFQILGGVSATQFTIQDINLTDWWDQREDRFLFFQNSSGNYASKITNVEDLGNGSERVTIEDSLTIDETFAAYALFLVLLGSNEEKRTMVVDSVHEVSLQFEEVPLEYESSNTLTTPVYLYEFKQDFQNGTIETIRLTSFDIDVNDGSNDWTSKNITHEKIERSVELTRDECIIRTTFPSNTPLTNFFPYRPTFPVALTIYEATHSGSGTISGATAIFSGLVRDVEPEGIVIKARVEGLGALLRRLFPRVLIGPNCNVGIFTEPCGLNPASYEKNGTLSLLSNANQVRVTNAAFVGSAENEFAGGSLDVGSGNQREVRRILSNSAYAAGAVDFVLSHPLKNAGGGETAKVLPGCDGRVETCDAYGNLVNYRGHANPTENNLSVEALPSENRRGNKK